MKDGGSAWNAIAMAGIACIGSLGIAGAAMPLLGTGQVDLGKPGCSTPSGDTLAMPFSQIDAHK